MTRQSIDQSRRGFFTGALLTREGKEQVKKKIQGSGLIPPGLEQTATYKNCNSCPGHCAKICPQKIIKRHPESHDLKGQPFLDFSIDGCTFCFECNEICPSLINDNNAPIRQLGKAELSHDSCYAWNGIICMSCINTCPENLLKFDNSRKPSIEQDSCTGCGFCIKNCPPNAIEITSPDIS